MNNKELINKISNQLFDTFVINRRYFAIQKFGYYVAERGCINEYTINRILQNKESFLCYQEDFNFIKWICFDFDINKEIHESEDYQKNKKKLYTQLIQQLSKLISYLEQNKIEYLLEYSGNRGIHLWIVFDEFITRQEGFLIFKSILTNSNLELDSKLFSLDKYPKTILSKTKTDKGIGVKIPLSFHQKSLKYSLLLKNLDNFDIEKLNINEFTDGFLEEQHNILSTYVKQNKDTLFSKLGITQESMEEEKLKINYLDSKDIYFDNIKLDEIIQKLTQCEHLNNIFSKSRPSEKEARVIVGLLGQLKLSDKPLGKTLLHKYFMSRERANETIIKQRLKFSNRLCPPTCDFFRNEYNKECSCDNIEQTPLQHLDNFNYLNKNVFEIDEDLFRTIVKSQIKYTKRNDEVALFHIINSLYKSQYHLISQEIESFLTDDYKFDDTYKFNREEQDKIRRLYSLSAKDKVITTFSIKVLDSIFYKNSSSRSYGYRFNPSFRNHEIFENWFKQWNIYISELKTIIYSEDFQEYQILKIDLKSFYDKVDLEKLQIELNHEINSNYSKELIGDTEKDIYINIIRNLIKITKKINNNSSKGLPQGPAYARYLAELYLSSLDKVIENKIQRDGYYFRYVDDIFIIVKDSSFLDEIYTYVKSHLDTKYLTLNDKKEYKGTIKGYIKEFSQYIDNTKYFVDKVSKNQDIKSKSTIHSASTKLIELVEDREGNINENNLTFLFTHLDDVELIKNKKTELEAYIINMSKGRGSFFNIFWKYYFDRYKLNDINFNLLYDLKELKRITLLNRILIVLKNTDQDSLKNLKKLLDYYLTLELTKIEKLLILEIYVLDNTLYNNYILNKIGEDFSIYNDLMLSEFSKKLPPEVLDKITSILLSVDEKDRLDYLYNIMLFSENEETDLLYKLSKIFVDTIHSLIKNHIDTNTYLYNKTTTIKYIQLLYISSLFYNEDLKSFENRIVLIWQNLFSNINRESFISQKDIDYLSYWTLKLNSISLNKTNINFIMPLIKDEKHNILTKYDSDTYGILTNYFDSLIELIYISNNNSISEDKDLKEIKNILINDKNVKYLEWLDGSESIFYPSKDICLRNAIFNDITILWKKNKILVRLKNELTLAEDLPYTNEEVSQELIFDKKYKTIIFDFNIEDFKKPYDKLYQNIFELLIDLNEIHKNLDKFSKKYFDSESILINHFYENFFIMNDNTSPLIAYDGFNKFFITDKSYSPKNKSNYFKYMEELIQSKQLDFFFNDTSKIFTSFSEHFFPKGDFSDTNEKLEYLNIFIEKIKLNIPTNIFQMEEYLINTIIQYYKNTEVDKNFYDIIEIYLSFNRNKENKKFIIFDNRGTIQDINLKMFINSISSSFENSEQLAILWSNECTKIDKKLPNIEDFEKSTIDYNVTDEEFEVIINGVTLSLDRIKYNYLDEDNALFHELTPDKLDIIKNNLTYHTLKEDVYNIVIISPIIRRTFEIIKDRNSLFNSNKFDYLFKPFKSLNELRHYPDFDNAVKVLDNHYHYNEKFDGIDSIRHHLFQWLKIFNNEDEILAILHIIANHKFISKKDSTDFVSKILQYKNKSYLITTLKNPIDNNGTHRLVNFKTEEPDLWRKTDLKDFPKALLKRNSKKLVLLFDVSISGSQIIKAFSNYYLCENIDNSKSNKFVQFFRSILNYFNPKYILEEEAEKQDYYKIDTTKYDIFRETLLSQKEIVFLCGLYTDYAENEIRKYFDSIGFKNKIYFDGKKESYNNCVFNGLKGKSEFNKFKEIVSNEEFISKHFNINSKYKKDSELNEKDGQIVKRNLIARFNSMPKKRFFLFTSVPKNYKYSLFQQMKD
ncbi:hypothetical protein CRV02_13135 [Arcobacter sp. CECT 8989]|uniref:RNA-directed DNA polymerase n=1 Tax=Arcobacter sp. CECT 8989 TaxID=2044509 RepID=UPI00100AC8AE|nr:RNA-directed DNA polymerase [Arcobacter sp. CECT 8989]RXJ98689.1 hypothetical protein CRV02_13135 [Arcobacter sp. CECT 8989]